MPKLKLIYIKSFLLLISFSSLFVSCSSNIVKNSRMSMIPGLWKTEKVKESFRITNNAMKSAVEDAENTIYLFNEDNTAEIRVRNISNKAEWILDGDWLILKREDDHLKFRLAEIKSNRMKLIIKYPSGELTYYLSRIETLRH